MLLLLCLVQRDGTFTTRSSPVLSVCLTGDCGAHNELTLRDPIVCRYCGYRIMYKTRTKQAVQFQAR